MKGGWFGGWLVRGGLKRLMAVEAASSYSQIRVDDVEFMQ